MISQRNIRWENITTRPKAASTAYAPGNWLTYDGSGHVVSLFPTGYVAGLCLEKVTSSDSDYASTRPISIDVPTPADEFLMPVTNGTATASMVGSPFDIDASDPTGLDVSGAGDQFVVTRFISATLVAVKVIKQY